MQLPANQRKMKNYVIRKDIQLKIAFTNLAYMISIILVMIASVLAPLYFDTVDTNQICNQVISGRLFVLLLDRLLVGLFVIIVVAFCHQIFITHQFCGPLANFSNTLRLASQGDFTRKIFLRKRDFLKQEALHINEMIDKLTRVISESRHANQEVLKVLNSIAPGEISPGEISNDKTLRDSLTLIRRHAEECGRHLSCFSLAGGDGKQDG
ncbi:MAG: hypothetical protein ACOZF0_12025 [Thermodesulfobacteriota bacterium]